MRHLLAAAILTGCLQQPDDLPTCGDGVCSLDESALSCPQDCHPGTGASCGDGVCEATETAATCPADCVPAPRCDGVNLGHGPVDVADSTAGAPSQFDLASCGDGHSVPAVDYAWAAPATGSYEISASGAFALVVVPRRGDCNGIELACRRVAPNDTGTVRLALDAGEAIAIRVTGLAGASGDFQLRVTRLPDACGDGACEIGEDCNSCPSDCGACVVCGDGTCSAGESCASCPGDCGTCTSSCGDGVCDATESCDSCSIDCGTCTTPYCGDGSCGIGEDCNSCPSDCGSCPEYCGDGSCGAGEDCGSCPSDCGSCPEYCGDGSCGAGEDCDSCPGDCGSCPEYCGDGSCGAGEDCDSCPGDCGSCDDPRSASSRRPGSSRTLEYRRGR